jgi:hypothetical protein
MENCKIRVNNESESKEAQELFFELGCSWYGCGKYYNRIGSYTFITAYPDEMLLRMGWGGDTDKEITLPQLRDLVVLKRNDVKDATHTCENGFKYIFINYRWYLMTTDGWFQVSVNTKALKPILTVQDVLNDLDELREEYKDYRKDPALIRGADAELVAQAKKFITSDHLNRFEAAEAHLEGHPVQFMLANGDFIDITSDTTLGIFEKDGGYSFRLKPQTIKLELELPKPFEPKDGEKYWIISDDYENGYTSSTYPRVTIGAWRTEEEIKQVVEQLRKIKGAV